MDNGNHRETLDSSHRPPRSRLRKFALGIVLGSLTAIAAAVIILAVVLRGDQLPPVTLDPLDAAALRWDADGPSDYDMDLELTGVNPGLVHVEVRRGDVTQMTLNDRPTRPHTWDNWSVPGLLSVIRRDVEACMAQAGNPKPETQDTKQPTETVFPRGTFDQKYGYPATYHRVTPFGADAKWRVTAFQPR